MCPVFVIPDRNSFQPERGRMEARQKLGYDAPRAKQAEDSLDRWRFASELMGLITNTPPEALRTVTSRKSTHSRMPLKTGDIGQLLAAIANPCKCYPNGHFLIRNQQVAGSIPAGGSS